MSPKTARKPTKDRRMQVRLPDDLEATVRRLAKHWSPIGEPLTPSEVFRECVERVARQEFGEAG
jgi:hypothetical protein